MTLGVLTLLKKWRVGGLPKWNFLIVLGSFVVLMGLDGLNSNLSIFKDYPQLYEPDNVLRLITGTLNGVALASVLYPIFQQTLWAEWIEQPILARWRDLGWLLLGAAVIIALVLTEFDFILYPLALLSSLGVVVMLAMINMVVLLLLTGQANTFQRLIDARWYGLAALTFAIAEIAVIDAGRFALFGTWAGLALPR
jgi:hypothetical protein